MELKRRAANFLLYEKKCDLVCFERPLYEVGNFRPDLLGVTRDRKLIEVEVKESFSDFKANFDKRVISFYRVLPHMAPHYFYFMVHPKIADKVYEYTSEKHKGYGIIIPDMSNFSGTKSLRNPIMNKQAVKVNIPAMIKMARNQSRSFFSEWEQQKENCIEYFI